MEPLLHFRSFDDLNRCIVTNLWKIPKNIDVVVGIPRSGLLAANLVALYLNKPFSDLEGFLNGKIFSAGQRLSAQWKSFDECRNVLVLDDSIFKGNAMGKAKNAIEASGMTANIIYGAVFSAAQATSMIDFYFDICPVPRMFEWNMMHHSYLEFCCIDLDGVLCVDPTDEENDDGMKYEQFLRNVPALFKPTVKLGYIVTNRLEKYRTQTEEWLQKNDILYEDLIMCGFQNREERMKANAYAEFKAFVYQESEALLFIESSEWQAREIANQTGKLVYCTDIRMMIQPH